MSDGTLDSWEERVDWALGQAGGVLATATERFKTGGFDLGTAEAASTLAESWRDLAAAWAERSLPLEAVEGEEEEEPVAARLGHE